MEFLPPIPPETAKVARAVFTPENFYLQVGDRVDALFAGLPLEDLSARIQVPCLNLARLYLILVFQVMETLADRPAILAVQERVDWKYGLHLEMEYTCIKETELSNFRKWLLAEQAGRWTFQMLLARISSLVETDIKEVLSQRIHQIVFKVCQVNQLDQACNAICEVLKALMTRNNANLRLAILPHWYDRYGNNSQVLTAESVNHEQLTHAIGADGYALIQAILKTGIPELITLPQVRTLQQLLSEQYEWVDGTLRWKAGACTGCSAPNQQ